MMLKTILGSDDEDDWGVADRRVKPALLTLLHDQVALVDVSKAAPVRTGDQREEMYDIRRGFPTERALIEWYQRAIVRTVGNIADDWSPEDCIMDETLKRAMVNGTDPMGAFKAKEYRSMMEVNIVLPACNQAYRDLQKEAAEYIRTPDEEETGEAELDPRKQKHVAMRPGFQNLDEQQHEALQELWGGFAGEDELKDWVHALNSPTKGDIDPKFAQKIITDPTAMDHLVYERHTDRARSYREALAVKKLLPAFVSAVEKVDTAELAKAQQTTPTTLRME